MSNSLLEYGRLGKIHILQSVEYETSEDAGNYHLNKGPKAMSTEIFPLEQKAN